MKKESSIAIQEWIQIHITKQEIISALTIILTLGALVTISFYSFLLFHSLAEIYSILICFSIFILAYNTLPLTKNYYLYFIGIAYLFVGLIDLFHALSYKGMGVFPDYDSNLPTQLWIIGRYMESLSLLVSMYFIRRTLIGQVQFIIYAIITFILFCSVFIWDIFPACFIENKGLTPFKIYSEYIISFILIATIVLLKRNKEYFPLNIYNILTISYILTIISELSFTFYVSVYGLSNIVGHIFKIISFYLVYKALIETGYKKPYFFLFRDFKQKEKELTLMNHHLKNNIQKYKTTANSLKESKEQFQIITELSPIGIYKTDQDGNCVYINSTWSRMSGLSESQAYGKGWAAGIHPDDRQMVLEAWNKMVESNGSWGKEYRFIDRTRKITWVYGTAKKIVDENDQTVGYIGFNLDITLRKKHEIDIQQAIEQAESANAMKSEFLANISHELRTPMHAILSFSKFGIDKLYDINMSKVSRYFTRINENAYRLMSLINDLLDLSKIESGKMKYYFELCDILAIFNDVKLRFESILDEKNLSIEISNSDCPTILKCDKQKMAQVFLNLLSNAAKFSPLGGVVQVKFVYHEQNKKQKHQSYIECMIKDQGPGIPETEEESIFDKFTQSSLTKDGTGGTGLGLVICRQIISKHNGKIWAGNNQDKGAYFKFTMPYIL